jgi:hypothetical protein
MKKSIMGLCMALTVTVATAEDKYTDFNPESVWNVSINSDGDIFAYSPSSHDFFEKTRYQMSSTGVLSIYHYKPDDFNCFEDLKHKHELQYVEFYNNEPIKVFGECADKNEYSIRAMTLAGRDFILNELSKKNTVLVSYNIKISAKGFNKSIKQLEAGNYNVKKTQ